MFPFRCIAIVEHMMVGIHQAVGLLQFQQLAYLAGIYQSVATHQGFIVRHRREDTLIIKVAQLDEAAAMHGVQSQFAYRHADPFVVGRYEHLDRIVAR